MAPESSPSSSSRPSAESAPSRALATSRSRSKVSSPRTANCAATEQIEDVNTLQGYRGRGFGRLVVQHALDEAARTNHDLVFLEALADDWPKALYGKLGFEIIAERHLFLRAPTPLARLRVRTPRLELRLATVAELRELQLVAEAGIHDPAAMPFSLAWTDSFDEES